MATPSLIPLSKPFQGYSKWRRLILTAAHLSNKNNDIEPFNYQPPEQHYRLWMLRYSHENGFLSWSRNAAICAGVSATLSILDDHTSINQVVSFGFMDLGLIFMTIGSLHHITSSFILRGHMKISRLGLLWIVVYTSSLWFSYYVLTKSSIKEQFTLLKGRFSSS